MRPGLRFFCGCSAALLFCPGDIAARRLKLRRKRLRRVLTPTLCFSRNPDKKELIMRTVEMELTPKAGTPLEYRHDVRERDKAAEK